MAVQFAVPRLTAADAQESSASDYPKLLQQDDGKTVDGSEARKEEEAVSKDGTVGDQAEAIRSGRVSRQIVSATMDAKTSSASASASASSNANANAGDSQTLKSDGAEHEVAVAAAGWPAVVKGLIRAVVETQRADAASSMLLAVFTPVVEGWANSRAEARRCKARSDAQMAELRRHRSELGGRADALEAEIESLHSRLAASQLLLDAKARESQDLMRESQAKDQTIQSQRTSFDHARLELQSLIDELRRALDEQRSAASELSAQNDELAKKAHNASLALEKLRRDSVAKQLEQAQDISSLQSKVRENEETIASLRQSLNESILKNRSLQEDLNAKTQEYTTLLNNRSATRVIPRRF